MQPRILDEKSRNRTSGGFTLTEMLVTLLIMTLASTLLATGVPVAVDTYRKTVNSANAQIALSTTLTVLRSELGTSTDVRVVTEGSDTKIYYLTGEGYWASIGNPVEHDGKTFRGLEKTYYTGRPTTEAKNSITGLDNTSIEGRYPLVSDSPISDPLHVSFEMPAEEPPTSKLTIKKLAVTDGAASQLAGVEGYNILLRFAE